MGRINSGVNAGRSTTAATSVATTHIPVRSPDEVFVHEDRTAIVNTDITAQLQWNVHCYSYNGMSVPREWIVLGPAARWARRRTGPLT
jgi:hypothetical protein